MSQVTKMEWKEELRKRWHLWNGHIGGGGFVTCHNEVVEFIEELLTLSESRVRGEASSYGKELLVLWEKSKTDDWGILDSHKMLALIKRLASLTNKEGEE